MKGTLKLLKRKTLKDGRCERCGVYTTLARLRQQYLCRDCFVGPYDPEYVDARIDSLIRGEHALAKIERGEDGDGLGFGKKRSGAK